MTQANRTKRIDELVEGDMIDLEGDSFADPRKDPFGPFVSEYAVVDYVEHETQDCIAIGVEGVDIFGFPPSHMVPFAGNKYEK